jgi:hypothetical protein
MGMSLLYRCLVKKHPGIWAWAGIDGDSIAADLDRYIKSADGFLTKLHCRWVHVASRHGERIMTNVAPSARRARLEFRVEGSLMRRDLQSRIDKRVDHRQVFDAAMRTKTTSSLEV